MKRLNILLAGTFLGYIYFPDIPNLGYFLIVLGSLMSFFTVYGERRQLRGFFHGTIIWTFLMIMFLSVALFFSCYNELYLIPTAIFYVLSVTSKNI